MKNAKEMYLKVLTVIRSEFERRDDLTVAQLAKDLDMNYNTLKEVVKGDGNGRVPSSQTVFAVAFYLGIDIQKVMYPTTKLDSNEMEAITKADYVDGMRIMGEMLGQKIDEKIDKKFDEILKLLGKGKTEE